MRSIALVTVEPKAVNARGYYARLTPEPAERTKGRLLLTRVVMRGALPRDTSAAVRALRDLRVDLVCTASARLRRELEAAAPYRASFRALGTVCLQRR